MCTKTISVENCHVLETIPLGFHQRDDMAMSSNKTTIRNKEQGQYSYNINQMTIQQLYSCLALYSVEQNENADDISVHLQQHCTFSKFKQKKIIVKALFIFPHQNQILLLGKKYTFLPATLAKCYFQRSSQQMAVNQINSHYLCAYYNIRHCTILHHSLNK